MLAGGLGGAGGARAAAGVVGAAAHAWAGRMHGLNCKVSRSRLRAVRAARA